MHPRKLIGLLVVSTMWKVKQVQSGKGGRVFLDFDPVQYPLDPRPLRARWTHVKGRVSTAGLSWPKYPQVRTVTHSDVSTVKLIVPVQ